MKKIIAVLFSAILAAACFTACGSSASSSSASSEAESSVAESSAAESSEEESVEESSEAESSEESTEAESTEESTDASSSEAGFTIDRSLLDWTADDWNAASEEEKLACCKAYTVYCLEIQDYDLSNYTDEILEAAAKQVGDQVETVFGVSGDYSLKEITDLSMAAMSSAAAESAE